jgi:ribosomal-protein-alanine N-acetyltransferase
MSAAEDCRVMRGAGGANCGDGGEKNVENCGIGSIAGNTQGSGCSKNGASCRAGCDAGGANGAGHGNSDVNCGANSTDAAKSSRAAGTGDGAPLVIADASPVMLAEIEALERLSFSDPWSGAAFRSLLDSPNILFRAALKYGRVAGYLVLIFAADAAQLANIAVDPALRRSGIGAALLDDAIEFCRRRGIVDVSLEVRESNAAARALYASRGFVDVGRRRGYYRYPVEDAIVMVVRVQ